MIGNVDGGDKITRTSYDFFITSFFLVCVCLLFFSSCLPLISTKEGKRKGGWKMKNNKLELSICHLVFCFWKKKKRIGKRFGTGGEPADEIFSIIFLFCFIFFGCRFSIFGCMNSFFLFRCCSSFFFKWLSSGLERGRSFLLIPERFPKFLLFFSDCVFSCSSFFFFLFSSSSLGRCEFREDCLIGWLIYWLSVFAWTWEKTGECKKGGRKVN